MVLMSISTQSEHSGHTVTWIDDSFTIRSRFLGSELLIRKLAPDAEHLTEDRSVVRLTSRRYRTTVDNIIANPKAPIRDSLLQAKEDAVRFALELPARVEAVRNARKKELLSKLSVASLQDE